MTVLETPTASSAEPEPPAPRDRSQLRRTIFYAVLLVTIAAASLGLALTSTTRETERPDATVLTQQDITDRLLRSVTGDVEIEVLYTPTWYFEWSRRPVPDTRDTATIGFFVFETVHSGVLPPAPPSYSAWADGVELEMYRISETDSTEHHRVTQVLFVAEEGRRLLVEDGARLEMAMAGATQERFGWDLDHTFGAGVISADAVEVGLAAGSLTVPALFAIFGGMLTALSPCLLLLATYYTAVLGGAAAEGQGVAVATRKMMTTSLFFIAGFTAIYTGGGVLAGYVGDSVSRLDNVGSWARPVSVVAGIAVILLGLRVAAQARVPMVCKIPGFNRPEKTGAVGSAVMGTTFAVGCLSCFSATVLSALLLYAGATGSPVTGGLIMLTFSATVGVVFLVAAYLVSQAVPLVDWMERARPYIGGISAAVMIALGILMVTYNFHRLTGWMFELWS